MAHLQNLLRNSIPDKDLKEICESLTIKFNRHCDYTNLISFHYKNITNNFDNKSVCESRGIILDEDDDWKIISHPYDKFFNYGEKHAAEIDWSTAVFSEKKDGCLMTIYYYDNKWHVSTSSKPDACGLVQDRSTTLAQTFWELWKKLNYQLPDADCNSCFMFEMVSKKQPTHISYEEDGIFLHGVRNLENDQLMDPFQFANKYGWNSVERYYIDCDVNTANKFVNSRSAKKYEGVIICDTNFNMVKLKSKEYVTLVYALSCYRTKPERAKKKIYELLVQQNYLDKSELLTYHPDLRIIVDNLSTEIDLLHDKIQTVWSEIKNIDNDKIFSSFACKHKFTGILFLLHRNKISSVREGLSSCDYKTFQRIKQ